jgi:hypothetical protein
MTSPYRIERDRGTKEYRHQFAVLREKWPLAFPVKDQDVRPLAIGATGEIAAAMGWSLPYTLGVLGRWKMAEVYCQAVLCHDQRIALDGSPLIGSAASLLSSFFRFLFDLVCFLLHLAHANRPLKGSQ